MVTGTTNMSEYAQTDLRFGALLKELPYEDLLVDVASKKQPVLFEQVCEETSKAWKKVSLLKLQIESLAADTTLIARSTLIDMGKKGTVDEVKSVVESDESLKAIKRELAEAEESYQNWQGLRRSFEMRAESIKIVASLINTNFVAYQ